MRRTQSRQTARLFDFFFFCMSVSVLFRNSTSRLHATTTAQATAHGTSWRSDAHHFAQGRFARRQEPHTQWCAGCMFQYHNLRNLMGPKSHRPALLVLSSIAMSTQRSNGFPQALHVGGPRRRCGPVGCDSGATNLRLRSKPNFLCTSTVGHKLNARTRTPQETHTLLGCCTGTSIATPQRGGVAGNQGSRERRPLVANPRPKRQAVLTLQQSSLIL